MILESRTGLSKKSAQEVQYAKYNAMMMMEDEESTPAFSKKSALEGLVC
jgi:hypothetical protein